MAKACPSRGVRCGIFQFFSGCGWKRGGVAIDAAGDPIPPVVVVHCRRRSQLVAVGDTARTGACCWGRRSCGRRAEGRPDRASGSIVDSANCLEAGM